MKIAAGVAGAIALVCTAGLAARAVGSSAATVAPNVVVVSSTADSVNGNVSSLSALKARPGRDGISLREALEATNKTGGLATLYILFSARLNGKAIEIKSQLPSIHRNHVTLEGVAPNGSPARVTLDGSRAPKGALDQHQLLIVEASNVTVRWLRFTGVLPKRNAPVQEPAIYVLAGRDVGLSPDLPPPMKLANVQITDNVFDERGINYPNTGIVGPGGVIVFGGANARISGITVARNTFRHETGNGDAVGAWSASNGAVIKDVFIEDNTLDQDNIGIELGDRYKSPRLSGVRIIGNTITDGGAAVSLDGNAVGGKIDQTLIADNVISGMKNGAINLDASAFGNGMADKPSGDVISNVQIVNNVISVPGGGIGIQGGNTTTTPISRVSGVTIFNDTLIKTVPAETNPAALLTVTPNGPGASGNAINDFMVCNTILYAPNGTAINQLTGVVVNQLPDVMTNSLISDASLAGTNGNITGDPLFVNVSAGDYQLAAGSPAINAGTTIGAPGYDINGARRDTRPDIGAFEFGAVPRPALTVSAEQLGGSGTVTSSPAGVNCGFVCSARFDPNKTVTLSAKPDKGSRFLGWQHGCAGKRRCTIKLNSAKSVTARFAP